MDASCIKRNMPFLLFHSIHIFFPKQQEKVYFSHKKVYFSHIILQKKKKMSYNIHILTAQAWDARPHSLCFFGSEAM